MPKGAESNDKKKRHDVWASWWKLNSSRVDPSLLRANPQLGYTLICDNGRNRVFEIDRHGKQRWAIDGLQNPLDAVVLPGNRVLIAEHGANRVTERDFKGNILWQIKAPQPVNVQRLPNGHTFIASINTGISEVDRDGKTIFSVLNLPVKLLAAYRSRRGEILCLTFDGRCLVLDTTGKQLKEMASGLQKISESAGNLDLRPNGHILIARTGDGNQVTEINGDGKVMREWKAKNALTVSSLHNGRLLIGTGSDQGVIELDGDGKIVWQHKGGQFFRARRR
jgi:hypothetical protein